MLKIALCDDNLDSIQLVKKFLESQIIEQNVNAEISIVTDNQEKIEEFAKFVLKKLTRFLFTTFLQII